MPDSTKPYSSQRTVNFYPEIDDQYKDKVVLKAFPGHTRWARVGGGPIRGMLRFGGVLIVVSGSVVYKVTSGGTITSLGTINTSTGFVSMDENGDELVIVDGADGWVYDGATLAQIVDATFTATNADQVAAMDGFFIVNQPGTGTIWVSDAFDATTWNALKTANAEFKSDRLTTIWTDRELYLGGVFTIQAFYNSGASPMPFEAIRSARYLYGTVGTKTVVTVGNTSYMLCRDTNGNIFAGRLNGSSIERVSTRALEAFWSGLDYTSAYAFAIHFKGHEWYVVTFPAADTGYGRTYLYDISVGWWTEIGPWEDKAGDFAKHPMLAHVHFDGMHLIGDELGWLSKLDDSVYKFGTETMISLRRSPVLHDKREKISIRNFTVDMETGNETPSVPDPKIRMRHSKDGGYTWKNTRYASTSNDSSNKRKHEVNFKQLGQARDWVFEISISDEVSRKILGGYVS